MTESPGASPPSTTSGSDPASVQTTGDSPAVRVTATCQDLLPLDTLRTVLGTDVADMDGAIARRSPDDVALRQAGALQCFWGNEDPVPEWQQHGAGYAYALLDVIPDGQKLWARHLEVYRTVFGPSPYGPDALGPRCNGADASPPSGSCDFEALVGDYRVSLALSGVRAGDSASDENLQDTMGRLIDPLLAELTKAADPAPPWSPPDAQRPLDCNTVLTANQAMAITGVTNLFVDRHVDGPATSPYIHGLEVTGANRCAIGIRDSDNKIGEVTYLPGGAWAFRALSPSWLSSGAEETALTGAKPDEQFIRQCSVDAEPCLVDLLVGGDWIQVALPPWLPEISSSPPGVDMKSLRAQVTQIAETVLANLHAVHTLE